MSCIIHEIHHSRKKISNLLRFFLIFWVSLSLLNQFPDDNIAKIQLLMAGYIHPHLGQVNIGLKFCHWNLNGINARHKIKIPLIEAYNSIFHYDIIALSETIINNSIRDEDIYISRELAKRFFVVITQVVIKRVVYVFTLKKLFPLNVERIWKVCKKLSLLR